MSSSCWMASGAPAISRSTEIGATNAPVPATTVAVPACWMSSGLSVNSASSDDRIVMLMSTPRGVEHYHANDRAGYINQHGRTVVDAAEIPLRQALPDICGLDRPGGNRRQQRRHQPGLRQGHRSRRVLAAPPPPSKPGRRDLSGCHSDGIVSLVRI